MGDLLQAGAGAVQDGFAAVGLQGNPNSRVPIPQTQPVNLAPLNLPAPNQAAPEGAPQQDQSNIQMDPLSVAQAPLQAYSNGEDDEEPALVEPVDNPYTPYDDPEKLSGPTIEVTGDSWQPDRMKPLEKVADYLLGGLLSRQNINHNMKKAFEETGGNHSVAIDRIRRHMDPQLAEKLETQHQAHESNKLLAEKRAEEIREKRGQALGQMFSIFKDDQTYQSARPTVVKMAERLGFSEEDVPEKFDPTTNELIVSKGLSVMNRRRLEQHQQVADSLVENRQSQIKTREEYNDARIQNIEADNQRADSKEQRIAAKEGQKPKSYFKEDGQFDGEMTADGRGYARFINGQWYAYKLRTPGDVNSGVRSPGDDAQIRKIKGALTPDKGD